MTRHTVHRPRVLVIEDDEDIRDVVQIILEDAGYTVTVAPDGAAALAVLGQAVVLPNLILLDVRMPLLDGSQFRQLQQAHPAWRAIPVVVLSTHTEAHAIAQALGLAAVLPKPFTIPALLDTVQRYCA